MIEYTQPDDKDKIYILAELTESTNSKFLTYETTEDGWELEVRLESELFSHLHELESGIETRRQIFTGSVTELEENGKTIHKIHDGAKCKTYGSEFISTEADGILRNNKTALPSYSYLEVPVTSSGIFDHQIWKALVTYWKNQPKK